jgi:glutamate racemase
VPLAEEGWIDHPATRLIAEEYLSELRRQEVDTLILGCTHYPVLAAVIQDVVGPEVKLVNTGAAAAHRLTGLLAEPRSEKSPPEHVMLVSDVPRKFQRIGERFLGRKLPEARQVEWKESWVVRREAIGSDAPDSVPDSVPDRGSYSVPEALSRESSQGSHRERSYI